MIKVTLEFTNQDARMISATLRAGYRAKEGAELSALLEVAVRKETARLLTEAADQAEAKMNYEASGKSNGE